MILDPSAKELCSSHYSDQVNRYFLVMNENTIAVLLPVYCKDNSSYLRESIRSVLNQTYTNFVLYIGVDGCVDNELKLELSSIKDNPKVKIFYFKENHGLAKVLNELLERAFNNGLTLFARMDADDISLPVRFELQFDFLLNNKDIDVVGGSIEEIDEEGNSRGKTIIYPQTPIDCRKFFSKRNPHAHPAVMFRKSFFEKVGHAYRPEYRQNQDTMLWLDGFSHGTNNANIEDVVLKFRMTDSLFKKRRNGWKLAMKQFEDRLMINRTLKYGITAYFFGFAMLLLQISPTWVRKLSYKIFR